MKPNKEKSDVKTKQRLRNPKEQKRDKKFQVRVTASELRQYKDAHGRFLSAVVRAFLSGRAETKKSILADSVKLSIFHALHAFIVEMDTTMAMAKNDPDLLNQMENQKQTLAQLLDLCYSTFSQ